MHWYLKVMTQNYANFSGRARRMEYWMFFLVYALITLVLGVLEGVFNIVGTLTAVCALAHLLPSLAVTVRRLHDTGRCGWWLLVALVPLIGALVLLFFMLSAGKPETNAYGPNPKTA